MSKPQTNVRLRPNSVKFLRHSSRSLNKPMQGIIDEILGQFMALTEEQQRALLQNVPSKTSGRKPSRRLKA